MKAIQYTAPRQFAVVDLPKPEPGPHQVVIRVKACGICKTDLTIHDGSFLAKFPLVNGHEFAGVIDSVGSAVTKWKVGDRVTADNTELCGYCEPCRSDKPLYCENFNSHGCNMPGGFAEYVLINHDKVFALSDKLSFEEATFTEPTACAVHGVDRIAPRFGDSILMFGAGPTGIILAQLLRRAGQFPALTGREPRQHLARHGGLQVDMELHLGHPAEKNSQVFHLIRSFLPHLFRCGRPLPRPCPFIVPRCLPCLNHFSEKPLPFCKIHVIILL